MKLCLIEIVVALYYTYMSETGSDTNVNTAEGVENISM
jgi:hypothetical protein